MWADSESRLVCFSVGSDGVGAGREAPSAGELAGSLRAMSDDARRTVTETSTAATATTVEQSKTTKSSVISGSKVTVSSSSSSPVKDAKPGKSSTPDKKLLAGKKKKQDKEVKIVGGKYIKTIVEDEGDDSVRIVELPSDYPSPDTTLAEGDVYVTRYIVDESGTQSPHLLRSISVPYDTSDVIFSPTVTSSTDGVESKIKTVTHERFDQNGKAEGFRKTYSGVAPSDGVAVDLKQQPETYKVQHPPSVKMVGGKIIKLSSSDYDDSANFIAMERGQNVVQSRSSDKSYVHSSVQETSRKSDSFVSSREVSSSDKIFSESQVVHNLAHENVINVHGRTSGMTQHQITKGSSLNDTINVSSSSQELSSKSESFVSKSTSSQDISSFDNKTIQKSISDKTNVGVERKSNDSVSVRDQQILSKDHKSQSSQSIVSQTSASKKTSAVSSTVAQSSKSISSVKTGGKVIRTSQVYVIDSKGNKKLVSQDKSEDNVPSEEKQIVDEYASVQSDQQISVEESYSSTLAHQASKDSKIGSKSIISQSKFDESAISKELNKSISSTSVTESRNESLQSSVSSTTHSSQRVISDSNLSNVPGVRYITVPTADGKGQVVEEVVRMIGGKIVKSRKIVEGPIPPTATEGTGQSYFINESGEKVYVISQPIKENISQHERLNTSDSSNMQESSKTFIINEKGERFLFDDKISDISHIDKHDNTITRTEVDADGFSRTMNDNVTKVFSDESNEHVESRTVDKKYTSGTSNIVSSSSQKTKSGLSSHMTGGQIIRTKTVIVDGKPITTTYVEDIPGTTMYEEEHTSEKSEIIPGTKTSKAIKESSFDDTVTSSSGLVRKQNYRTEEVVKMVGGKLVKTTRVIYDEPADVSDAAHEKHSTVTSTKTIQNLSHETPLKESRDLRDISRNTVKEFRHGDQDNITESVHSTEETRSDYGEKSTSQSYRSVSSKVAVEESTSTTSESIDQQHYSTKTSVFDKNRQIEKNENISRKYGIEESTTFHDMTEGKHSDEKPGLQKNVQYNREIKAKETLGTEKIITGLQKTSEVVKMVGGKLVKTMVIVDDARATNEQEGHITTYGKNPLPAAGKQPKGDRIVSIEPFDKYPDEEEPTEKYPSSTYGKPRDKPHGIQPDKKSRKPAEPEDLFLKSRKPSETDFNTSETTHTTEVVKMVGGKLVKTTVFVDDRRVTDETESHVTTFEKKPLPAAGKPSKPVDKFGKPIEEEKIPKEPTDKKPKNEKEEPSGKPAAGVPSKPKSKPEDQIKMVEPYDKYPKDGKEHTKKSPAGTPGKPRDKPDSFQPDKKSRKPGEPEDLFLEPRKSSDTDFITSETTHTTEVMKMVGGKLVKTTVFVEDRRSTDETESHHTTVTKKPLPAAGKPSKPVDKFGRPIEDNKHPTKELSSKKPQEKEEMYKTSAPDSPMETKQPKGDRIVSIEPFDKYPDEKEPTEKSPSSTYGKPRDKPQGIQPDKKSQKPSEPEDLFVKPREPSETDFTTSETTHTTEVVKMVGGKLVKTTVFVDDRRVTDETESHVTTFEKKPLPAAGKPSKPVDKFGKPLEEEKIPKEPTDKKPKKEKEEPSGKPAAGVPSKPKSKPEDQIKMVEPYEKHPKDDKEPTKKSPAGTPGKPRDKPEDLFLEPRKPSETDYTTSETTHTTEVVKMVGGKLVKTTVFVDDRRVTDETESHVTTFEKKPLPAAGKPSKPVDKFGKPIEEDEAPKKPIDKKPKKGKEEPSGKPAAGVPSKPKSIPEDQIKMVEPYGKYPKDEKEPTKKSPAGTPGKPRDKPDSLQPDKKSRKPGEPEDLFLEPRKSSDTDFITSETTHTTEVMKMVGGKLVKTTVFVEDRRSTDETESHHTTVIKKTLPAAGKPSKPVDKFGRPIEDNKHPTKELTSIKPQKKEELYKTSAPESPKETKQPKGDRIVSIEPFDKYPDEKEPTEKSPSRTYGKPRDKPQGIQPDKKSRKPGEPEDLFVKPREPSETDFTTSETTHTTEVVKMVGGKLVKTTVFVDDRRVTDETESHVTTFEKKPLPAAGKPSKPVDKFGKPIEEDKTPKEPTDKKPKKEKEEPSGKPAAGVPSKPKSKPEDQIKMVEPYDKYPKDEKEPTKKSPAGTPGKPRDKPDSFQPDKKSRKPGEPEDLFLEPRKSSDTDFITSETTHTTEVMKMVGGKLVKTTVFVEDRRSTDETESHHTTVIKKPLPAAGKPSKPVDKFGRPIEDNKHPTKELTSIKPQEKEELYKTSAPDSPKETKQPKGDRIVSIEPFDKYPDEKEPTEKSPSRTYGKPRDKPQGIQPDKKSRKPGEPEDLFVKPRKPSETDYTTSETTHTAEVVKMVGGKLVKTTVFVDDRRVTDETESHVTTFEKKPLPAAGKPSKPVDKFGKPVEEDKIPKEPTDKKPKKEKEEPSGKPAAGVPSKPKSKPEDQIKMVEPYEKHPKDDKEPTKKSPAGTPGKPRDKPEDLFLEPRKPSDTDYTTSETTHTTEVVKMVGGKLVKTTVFVDDRRVTDETESHVTTFEKKPHPAAGKPSKPVDKFGKPVEEDKIPKEPTDKKPKKEKEEPSGKPAAGVPSKPKSKPEDQIKMVEPYEKHPKDDKEPTKKSPAGTPGKPRDKPEVSTR
ncbi:hypothetical protein J6590_063629 [Homalodisca vitripennis]|nr:hypothetical protein J6590_063629 [Homalodisca vitripennis]